MIEMSGPLLKPDPPGISKPNKPRSVKALTTAKNMMIAIFMDVDLSGNIAPSVLIRNDDANMRQNQRVGYMRVKISIALKFRHDFFAGVILLAANIANNPSVKL